MSKRYLTLAVVLCCGVPSVQTTRNFNLNIPPFGTQNWDGPLKHDFNAVESTERPYIDVTKAPYNAVPDGQVATDCYMTAASPVLTCETAHFAAGDVGKKIVAYGNGPSANGYWQPLSSSIVGYTSATQVTLNDVAIQSTNHTIATISSATRAGNAGAAISTYSATSHGFSAGQIVNIKMTNNSDQTYTGLEPINTVPTGDSFTVRTVLLPMVNGTGGGTADGHSYRVVWGTDNTAALQAAVDMAATNGGGQVHFPGAVAGMSWTGLYLTHGINMPCSVIGNFVTGTCTLAYNNISLIGDGQNVTQLENWDTGVSTRTYPALISIAAKAQGFYDLTSDPPLKNIEVCCMTLREVPNSLQKVFGELGASDHVRIHNTIITGGKAEGVYQGGKSTNWEIDHNFFTLAGSPINASIGLAAIVEGGSYSTAHDNYVENSGQCMEGSGHDDQFYSNTCTGAGLWITSGGAAGLLCINLSSATYGLWNWLIRNNKFIGCGTSIGDVNGQLANITVENNSWLDSAGVQLGTGKETNNVTYGPQLQSPPHGISTIRNNDFVNDGLYYNGNIIGLNNNSGGLPFLESGVIDANTFTFEHGYCSTVPHTSCDRDAGCTTGTCYVPTTIYSSGGVSVGAAKWLPGVSCPTTGPTSVVVPALDNTYIYMNKGSAGTTGATEPAWCMTSGCIVSDNSCTWTLYSHRPTLTISNNRVVAPAGLPSAGSSGITRDVIISNGTTGTRKNTFIQNLTSNIPLKIQSGTGTGGRVDGGLTNEIIPAGAVASDSQHYSDTLPTAGYWTVGQQINKITPASGASPGWVVTRAGYYGSGWVANTTCTYGDFVTAVPDDAHVFRAINASPGTTSNPTQPTWSTGAGATTTDNTCTWQESGAAAQFTPVGPSD